MPFFVVPLLMFATTLLAVEQVQPTPYDLIRPIWPMKWDTSATDNGGTVESFSSFKPNPKKHNPVPKVGTVPGDFAPNAIIPDTLNQAYRDAQNLRIGRIRVNQAGYLPEDPEKQFHYLSAGTCDEEYYIVDLEGNVVAGPGKFTSTGLKNTSSWVINAGTDAATNNQGRYETSSTGPSGTICLGHLADIQGLETNTRYRINVLKQYSGTFIISDKVYSMVRDATLKFYGINRSGNSESWFHKPSHTKDGSGKFVSGKDAVTGFTALEGALQGGWYDCGDHLKESQTQAYAFMVLAVMAASSPERDEDHYAYNMGETQNTDGIPDILREAKHGADFFMNAYRFADGIIDNMAVSVGNFGADHGWWGRPENQDALPATLTGRGGPHERDLRLGELGSNISGQIAAGLAILSKEYQDYDKPFADSCLVVAEKMYDFAKNLKLKEKSLGPGTYDGGKKYVYNTKADGWSSAAYNGNNESHDDLAIAAIALHYATYEKTGSMDYLNDAVEDKTIGVDQESSNGFFNGGWMAWSRDGMRKSSKNTSWANAYTYTLYGFYKMLLKDTETGLKYGINDNTRLKYAENVALTLATNLSYLSGNGTNSIIIPTLNGPTPVTFGDLWYSMQTDQTWIYNRYQAGNIFEVLAYSDVTKDLEGKVLPQKGAQNWNSTAMKQMGINQLNYMLGVNPWDVSFLLGVGDKNDAHPHHRAANPEGKNMPGAGYKYNPPTGALFGGITPDDVNAWDPGGLSWENYHIAETCIDATAMFVASSSVAVREEDRNRAPSDIDVEIRYVGFDSAIVKIGQDLRGPAMILYSTSETGPFNKMVKDSENGVSHEIHMTGLENGTTYYFKVVSINIRSEAYTTKWLVDSTATPFSFTTLVSPPGEADIQNVKVCNLTADTAEIMWFTPNGQYESKVYWDTTLTTSDKMTCPGAAAGSCDIQGNADVSGIPTSFHYVKIGKLREKTTYYYCVESNGKIRCNDDKGLPLKFTTPVGRYAFDVRTYQYYEQGPTGMDRININIYNNEDRQFDSLELRFYVTSKPSDIEIQEGVNGQPGVCPLMIDEEICQAYDEAGFNKPCETDREIRDLLRGAPPVRLDDTYNAATGEYSYYIPVPLGSTMIKSSSRMRLDLAFSRGIYQQGKCDPLYSTADKRLSADLGDWTWIPHKRAEDGADYAGMPVWDKDDGDQDQAPVNPYVVVYRKDEFIVGFSPSYQEMMTKRAEYKIDLSFEAPFDVSNGSNITIDTATRTLHLRGKAFITESGYVTSIWVNGVALTKEQMQTAAVYDPVLDRYNLDIPAKMKIGTNKVDVTVFAGPNPECEECQENGGCAFVNRNYFINYSQGDRTSGTLQLITDAGSSVTSPAPIDGSLNFKVTLKDKDNRQRTFVTAWIYNSRTKDSVQVTLNRTDETLGYFSSDMLNAAAKEGNLPLVPFYGGDTVMVKYEDLDDEDDRDSVWFFALPTKPVPQVASLSNDPCTSTGSILNMEFSGSLFDGVKNILDSVVVQIDATDYTDAKIFALTPAAPVTGSEASFMVPDSMLTTAFPRGNVTVYLRENGTASAATVSITDKVSPTLTSVAILENENHLFAQDTIRVGFSEPISLSSKNTWPFLVYSNGKEMPQDSIKIISATSDDNGKNWQYVIEGNAEGLFAKGMLAQIAPTFKIYDLSTNNLATCDPLVVEEIVRPVPVKYAKMTDFYGDGQPDEVYVEFVRVLRPEKDFPDTIDTYWGNPAVRQVFAVPEGGWNSATIAGDTIKTQLTLIDSANGTWFKGAQKKECKGYVEKEECATKTNYVVDSLTGLETDVIASIDTLSCNMKPVCSGWNITQDSSFVPAIVPVLNDDGTPAYSDSIVNHTVIRIPVPAGTYKLATVGANGGKGVVHPRKGAVDGPNKDNKYTLYDDCPPVIISASWRSLELSSGTQKDFLDVETSEPIKAVTTKRNLFERRREGQGGVYYSLAADASLGYSQKTPTVATLDYDHENNNAIHPMDSIRFDINQLTSYFTDEAGVAPREDNPWVEVNGQASEVKFKVELPNPVTIAGNSLGAYGGEKLPDNIAFRLTINNKAGQTFVLAQGDNQLRKFTVGPMNNYFNAGPVFKTEIILPELLKRVDSLGNQLLRNYEIAFDLSIFNNMGSFVNSATYTLNTRDIEALANGLDDYASAGNSSITLNLEWCAPTDYPVSSNGKKIGTGPYIAKFKYKAKRFNFTDTQNSNAISDADDTITKTFGFRRSK